MHFDLLQLFLVGRGQKLTFCEERGKTSPLKKLSVSISKFTSFGARKECSTVLDNAKLAGNSGEYKIFLQDWR